MTSDPTTTATALEWSTISASGAQAEEYLQGQLSQDLTALDASGRWSLLLRPDGIVVCASWVARSEGVVRVTVPRALADAALERLTRFLLRVDCRLELADAPTGPFATTAELVDAGWPGAREFAAQLVPQCFGDAFVAATVSFVKGCFTGQELVGRLDARRAPVPWRLVRASGPSLARVDEVLRARGPAGPQGATTAVDADTGVQALGFAHRTLLDPAVLVGFADVAVEAL